VTFRVWMLPSGKNRNAPVPKMLLFPTARSHHRSRVLHRSGIAGRKWETRLGQPSDFRVRGRGNGSVAHAPGAHSPQPPCQTAFSRPCGTLTYIIARCTKHYPTHARMNEILILLNLVTKQRQTPQTQCRYIPHQRDGSTHSAQCRSGYLLDSLEPKRDAALHHGYHHQSGERIQLNRPEYPIEIQTLTLSGVGNAFQLSLSNNGKSLYVLSQRAVTSIPEGQGNVLHSLSIKDDGTLQETGSGIAFNLPSGTRPQGVAVVDQY
jgi:hypothetical protein